MIGFIYSCFIFNSYNKEFPVRGLFTQAALLAHDCIGNTFITVDGNNKLLKVYASVDIKMGEIIYNNYTASLYVSYFIWINVCINKMCDRLLCVS